MDYEKHRPIIYQIYQYLKLNCAGYDNKKSSNEIMEQFNINDNKTFRSYIEEIRQSDTLQKFICSEAGQNGGYWVATNQEEVNLTLHHLLARAHEMLKTYSILKRKARLNNQMRMKLNKYEKDIYESILENKVD